MAYLCLANNCTLKERFLNEQVTASHAYSECTAVVVNILQLP